VPTPHTLVAFSAVSLGILVLPGPSTLFILAQGIVHGRPRALAATAGVELACAVRVLATAAGLSALLASSTAAFTAIRWAGVAYLAYLGVRSMSSGTSPGPEGAAFPAVSLGRSMRKGLLTGLGNPKMVVFFVAFFPQFVHSAQGAVTEQILVLGSVFWVTGTIWDAGLAWASAAIGVWLRTRPRVRAVQPRVEGGTYLGLAGWCAISG
jgi:threonine/homoserine/homoserine lactone efflux protein